MRTNPIRVWISRGPKESGQQELGTVWHKKPSIFGSGGIHSWIFLRHFARDLKPGESGEFEIRRIR